MEKTYYETVCSNGGEEPYELVDAHLGSIDRARLPYVLKNVRLNGRHIRYMLDRLKEMPSDIEKEFEEIDSLGLDVDLSSYVPSHPR